jgi:hypothetical protein
MNSNEMHRSLQGLCVNLNDRKLAPGAKIEFLYLAILGRPPIGAEGQAASRYVSSIMSNQPEGIVDIAWILINSSEFIFNH